MSPQPESCDTFVVLPNLTHNQEVIFGKNSDRPRDEVQEIVYIEGKKHEPDAIVQVTSKQFTIYINFTRVYLCSVRT